MEGLCHICHDQPSSGPKNPQKFTQYQREILLRKKIEHIIVQNHIELAIGIGKIVGIPRLKRIVPDAQLFGRVHDGKVM